jgi:hypothetical protein
VGRGSRCQRRRTCSLTLPRWWAAFTIGEVLRRPLRGLVGPGHGCGHGDNPGGVGEEQDSVGPAAAGFALPDRALWGYEWSAHRPLGLDAGLRSRSDIFLADRSGLCRVGVRNGAVVPTSVLDGTAGVASRKGSTA